jgi:hypothetical protein
MRLTIAGKNGSLHQYTQKVTNKRGEIVLSDTRTVYLPSGAVFNVVNVFYNKFANFRKNSSIVANLFHY